MKRRWMAGVAVASLVLSAAAGCRASASSSGGGGSSPGGVKGMITKIGAGEGRLNLIVWQGSTDPDAVAAFAAETGCNVHVTDGQTSDQMARLLSSGSYDGVLAPGDTSSRLIAAGEVSPIDPRLIPGFKDISPELQSPPFNTLNGIHYGVSYEWGANLLMYNTDVVKPAPDSWAPVFDGTSYAGKVTGYDSPIYIADAALYLKVTQPSLGITDPYELTQPQFDAAIALLKVQHAQIDSYWSSVTSEIQDFKQGNVVIGQAWPYQENALKADGQPINAVLPKEGATGWSDSWMMYSGAVHPNCMLKWMAYATTPIVQGKTAYTFGSAPANPQACVYLDSRQANYCADHHVTDSSYFSQISFWKTPLRNCGDGKDDCVPYPEWAAGWLGVTGG